MSNDKAATFYFVRHGETDWNRGGKVQGTSDIPLNGNGKKQAQDAAERLKNVTFDLAFSSDLMRAKETAEIIALKHKLAVQTTEVLRERHYGRLEAADYTVAKTYFDLVNKLANEARFTAKCVEDAESDQDIIKRLLPFIRETAIANPGKNILVATHGSLLLTLLVHLGKITYEASDTCHIANTAHVVIQTDGVEFFTKELYGISITGKLLEK